jgi:hypothetical protein
METALIEKCWKDPSLRREWSGDPKSMLERHTDRDLPEQIRIFVHEEDANTLHLAIPVAPANLSELSDEDLAKVAGGTDVALTMFVATRDCLGSSRSNGSDDYLAAGLIAGRCIRSSQPHRKSKSDLRKPGFARCAKRRRDQSRREK